MHLRELKLGLRADSLWEGGISDQIPECLSATNEWSAGVLNTGIAGPEADVGVPRIVTVVRWGKKNRNYLSGSLAENTFLLVWSRMFRICAKHPISSLFARNCDILASIQSRRPFQTLKIIISAAHSCEIKELYRALPPQNFATPKPLPSLLLSLTGQGFVTAEHTSRHFKKLAITIPDRISVSSLSRDLDVDSDIVLSLVRGSPTIALLSADKAQVVCKAGRDAILTNIQDAIDRQIATKSVLSKEFDISVESIELLKPFLKLCHELSHVVSHGHDEYLISSDYHERISATIMNELDEALKSSSAVTIVPSSFPGSPPTSLVSEIHTRMLRSTSLGDQFYIGGTADAIRCVPKDQVLRKMNAKIDSLHSGDLSCLDATAFANEYQDIYASSQEARDFLQNIGGVFMKDSVAISQAWLDRFTVECTEALGVLGYADVMPQLEANFPAGLREQVRGQLEEDIKAMYEKRSGTTLYVVGTFLLTEARYCSERDVLLEFVKTHALSQWKQLAGMPERDIKFQLSAIINLIPQDQPILRAMSEDKGSRNVAEEQYWGEISKQEALSEDEFSEFWSSRVTARVLNYAAGLDVVQEEKLRGQLSELLAIYIGKELVPEMWAKAQAQGLAQSRKTKKNFQKLEVSLKASKELVDLVAALEKFDKKQGSQEVGPELLERTKGSLVADMKRRMQKQSDAPTLFLITVLALFARHKPGLIYATGKYSPKIMKQIKSSLSAEEYEELEGWKESAKAGTLGDVEKDSMRRRVGAEPA
ncbi:hypothetical protein BU24DRAFT_404591 [Aaosphaeria arxii CBS 175.79]|uniref:Uncharacterized protein n=1 Tax=Aaosphaeria arxii CBS 175.79 TaxID=1450172 RepID=A0A6A5Y8D1_9PLEO|nr:uncharacterized protein BU24DRAFT_404591 [Aaosphaeria arxii CBS 175.79]KAF2021589.1 hypothetical protein BU24DRAFT_404591 [Aaosphaeria arxii CBS 175.79]